MTVDKNFCMSSYLALRYVEKPNTYFMDSLRYKRPTLPTEQSRILVRTAKDIDQAIASQLSFVRRNSKKTAILLSGGMDSAILAAYLPGCDAYTFRFLGGDWQKDELARAESYANAYDLHLHYVDISWKTVLAYLPKLMQAKGGPVHSIEPQICQGAKQAKDDGADLMIIGDGSDYVFGGMDQLLSKDWTFDAFMKRYIYIDPFSVLNEAVSMQYLFERYRKGNLIDFIGFMDTVATEESYGSYSNAFEVASLSYYDPYERLKMAEPLDLKRVRNGESKYLIRDLFKMKYPDIPIPNKVPMPRPVDEYFKNWQGPTRPEFKPNLDMSQFTGNQKWQLYCLEQFLNEYEPLQ